MENQIDVICDLRGVNDQVTDIGSINSIWHLYASDMVGLAVQPRARLEIASRHHPGEKLVLWIIENHGIQQIRRETQFQ